MEHSAEFRLRDIATLLRGCCVIHLLRVDHLLRDVERELAKFFMIVQRLGQAKVIDKSIQAYVHIIILHYYRAMNLAPIWSFQLGLFRSGHPYAQFLPQHVDFFQKYHDSVSFIICAMILYSYESFAPCSQLICHLQSIRKHHVHDRGRRARKRDRAGRVCRIING